MFRIGLDCPLVLLLRGRFTVVGGRVELLADMVAVGVVGVRVLRVVAVLTNRGVAGGVGGGGGSSLFVSWSCGDSASSSSRVLCQFWWFLEREGSESSSEFPTCVVVGLDLVGRSDETE